MMSINQSAYQILEDLDSVLAQLTNEDLKTPLKVLSQASIGQHVRHTLEFFICLMDAKFDGVINYDNRRHDKLIETDITLTKSVIQSVKDFLVNEKSDFPLKLEANYQLEGSETVLIDSNFYRELAYNIEHAIHHMALIKIGVCNQFPEVRLPDHFGVASSTVRYQRIH